MSAVRMCDRCGNIFSEREDGWSTAQGTMVKRDEKGRQTTQSEVMDTCPQCTTGPVITPRLAVTSATGVDRIARTLTEGEIEEQLRAS